MPPAEDSDEEWERIAAAVSVIEAQYMASTDRQTAAPASSPDSMPVPDPASSITVAQVVPMVAQAVPTLTRPNPIAGPSSHALHPTTCNASHLRLNAESNPYALAIRERDARIEQLEAERRGEVANYRNKLQYLQTQLHTARRGNAHPPASATMQHPRSVQLEHDAARLTRELAAAQRDAHGSRERLAFAEHQLSAARDRERSHLAALSEQGFARAPTAPGNRSMNLEIPTQIAMPTQAGEVVEATQLALGVRPTSSQGFSMRKTVVRAPVRRRRRPGSAGGSAGGGSAGAPRVIPGHRNNIIENVPPLGSVGDKRRSAEENRPMSKGKEPELVHSSTHGWAVRLDDATWEHNALRKAVFGGGLGQQLLDISARVRGDGLRGAILGAMASDEGWVALMASVGRLFSIGRGVTLVAAECLDRLLTFSTACRTAIGTGQEKDGMRGAKACLEKATAERDARVAEACMRVLLGGACGAAEIGCGGRPEIRAAVRCEAGLEWIRGKDKDGGRNKARITAIGLAEAVCGLVLEDDTEDDEDVNDENGEREVEGSRGVEWAYVERAFATLCKAVTEGEGSNETVRAVVAVGICAALRAPYLVSECGGGEAVAHIVVCAVRDGDKDGEWVETCCEILCVAGRTGRCGLKQQTRDVLLGVMAGVGGRAGRKVLRFLAAGERPERGGEEDEGS